MIIAAHALWGSQHVCVCVCVYARMWRLMSGVFLKHSSSYFREHKGLPLNLGYLTGLDWLAGESQRVLLSLPPHCWSFLRVLTGLSFHMGSGVLNSGPQAFTEGIFPTEPSPQCLFDFASQALNNEPFCSR